MANDPAILKRIKSRVVLPALLAFFCWSAIAQSFIFTPEVKLHFGELVITSNASKSSTTIKRNGATTSSGHIFIINQGTPGEYTISDAAPFVALNLSIDVPVDSSAPFPGTEQLRLSAVDMPSQVIPDSTGSVTFRIGATIETSGNGGTYLNPGTYPFIIKLDITY